MPLITALDFLRRREASCVVLVLSRGMLAAGADAMSKWFGTAESPEDNEEMFKRFSIDQNEKYGEGGFLPPPRLTRALLATAIARWTQSGTHPGGAGLR